MKVLENLVLALLVTVSETRHKSTAGVEVWLYFFFNLGATGGQGVMKATFRSRPLYPGPVKIREEDWGDMDKCKDPCPHRDSNPKSVSP